MRFVFLCWNCPSSLYNRTDEVERLGEQMKKRIFGRVDGTAVEEITLESASAAVSIISLGTCVRDWRVDGPKGSLGVVLGFPKVEDYVEHARSHGVIAGRIANRTANSEFELEGRRYQLTTNDGPNHLHGGVKGLERRVWNMDHDEKREAVILTYSSPDGEQGYPGHVEFMVEYRLEGPRLICEMHGRPDRPTPINLAQHSYYNLGTGPDVRGHILYVDAAEYTPSDDALIPLGTIETVEGTHLDFRTPRAVGDSPTGETGLDNNLVLVADRDTSIPAATVYCEETDLQLSLWTKEPAIQVFNAAEMVIDTPGHDGKRYGPYAGLCVEAQHFPDSMHNPDWPSIIRTPENPYFQQLMVEIG